MVLDRWLHAGAVVIDDSRLRMDPDVPLVVTEVNPHVGAEASSHTIARPFRQ
jgi:aspartate-semialdehyde dehydrogenase